MLDQIISKLQQEAAPALMSKLGLDNAQAGKSVSAVGDSIKEVLGGNGGINIQDALNLFSSAKNSGGADAILGKLGTVMHGKLTGQAGLDAGKAQDVKAMLMPMVTDFITKHVGGDMGKLQGLLGGLGGNAGNLAEQAKGLLGGLFGKK